MLVAPPRQMGSSRSEDLTRCPKPTRSRPARRLIIAGLGAAVLVVLLPRSAGAAPASSHLSAQGWQTYRAYMGLNAIDIDMRHPARAHAQLRGLIRRCSHLPGHGTQSTGVRTICRHEVRVLDRFAVADQCGDSTAVGLCVLAALPAIDGHFAAGARAGGTVAATLAPGRCRRAFATQALTWGAAATSGSALLATLRSRDEPAVDAATNRWGDALEKALDAPVGQSVSGCRPGR